MSLRTPFSTGRTILRGLKTLETKCRAWAPAAISLGAAPSSRKQQIDGSSNSSVPSASITRAPAVPKSIPTRASFLRKNGADIMRRTAAGHRRRPTHRAARPRASCPASNSSLGVGSRTQVFASAAWLAGDSGAHDAQDGPPEAHGQLLTAPARGHPKTGFSSSGMDKSHDPDRAVIAAKANRPIAPPRP